MNETSHEISRSAAMWRRRGLAERTAPSPVEKQPEEFELNVVSKQVAAVVVLAVTVVVVGVLIASRGSSSAAEQPPEITAQPQSIPKPITAETLQDAAQTRVYFGHQSVGANMISAIPGLYETASVAPPFVIDATEAPTSPSFFANSQIGSNGDPASKIEDFARILRAGMGQSVQVAAMKLCYVDVTAGTDVEALFKAYSATMDQLSAQFPDLTLLYTTVPLTAPSDGRVATLKSLLGKQDPQVADNLAREKYNQLVRQAYGDTGRLFDIAALESTRTDGSRSGGTVDSQPYFELLSEYTYDGGHLNDLASGYAAAYFLQLVADAAGQEASR